MFREAALAASIALGIGMPEEARADLFQFNPTGGGLGAGLINGAAVLDLAPGNELGIGGGLGGAPLPAGTIIPDLYQANLSSVIGASGNNLFSNGAGGAFFTFVAGFTEQLIASSSGGGAVTNSFKILPGGFFKMCATSTAGNDLAGTGFACAGGGILSGHAIDGAATQTGFVTDLVDLDQFDGNQRGGTTTVTSVGSASLRFEVDSVLTSYFPDLVKGGHITFNMTNSTPFTVVNPSFLFSSDGIANGNLPDNIGTTNGITGPNFQVQADANFAFQRQGSVIPEPGSLALLSLGLVGLAAFARRRGNGSTPPASTMKTSASRVRRHYLQLEGLHGDNYVAQLFAKVSWTQTLALREAPVVHHVTGHDHRGGCRVSTFELMRRSVAKAIIWRNIAKSFRQSWAARCLRIEPTGHPFFGLSSMLRR